MAATGNWDACASTGPNWDRDPRGEGVRSGHTESFLAREHRKLIAASPQTALQRLALPKDKLFEKNGRTFFSRRS
jgi:hypothetical protein